MSTHDFLATLGIAAENPGAAAGAFLETSGEVLTSINPSTNEPIATVKQATKAEYETVVAKSAEAFREFRSWPAPKRGEIVRQVGLKLREHKDALGRLVSLECGKIYQEGLGEVQEMIDICDFAVGLSRQLHGLTMHSERPGHRMYEQWHPMGPTGIITAFNFPVAVWAWNAMIATVCGNSTIWKPSEMTPLTGVACHRIFQEVLEANDAPEGVAGLVIGTLEDVGHPLTHDKRVPLISATGSCRMGQAVSQVVAGRFGRCILELGGNNAIIVRPSADLDLVVRGTLFGAVGTAGQRCTTTRRLYIHSEVAGQVTERLVKAYEQVKIGDPLEDGTLVGPLINEASVVAMEKAVAAAKEQGGEVLCGGERYTEGACAKGNYVKPTIIKGKADMPIIQEETFAPILYIVEVDDLQQAIAHQNEVPQGLSSAIFTRDLLEAEEFLSTRGSDCGIANVNIGTSGAEIGGAFGGEKETGGGRESGSDAWKGYMRRQTCTINYSTDIPLAQGIQFG